MAAQCTFLASEIFTQKLDDKGFKYANLEGDQVTEKNIRKIIHEERVRGLFFFGHGSVFRLLGDVYCDYTYGRKAVVDVFNVNELGLDFIFALACHSGRGLGPYCTQGNVKAYLGCIGPITLYATRMGIYGEAITKGIASMVLDNASVDEALEMTQEQIRVLNESYAELYETAEKSQNDELMGEYIFDLQMTGDLHSFICKGGDAGYRLNCSQGGRS